MNIIDGGWYGSISNDAEEHSGALTVQILILTFAGGKPSQNRSNWSDAMGQQLLTSFRLDRSNKCMTCHERNLWLRSRSGDTCYLLKHFKTCWNHSLRFSAVVGLGAFSFSSQFFDHILDNLNVMMTIYDNLYLCLDWISTFGDLRCSFRRQLWPVTETSSQPEPQPPLKPGERKLSQETTRGRGHEWVGKWSTLKISQFRHIRKSNIT